jgi:hypothetical protein
MRSPSVTTATFKPSLPKRPPIDRDGATLNSFGARSRSATPTFPASSAVMYTPLVFTGKRWYVSHASPTVGVYTKGMISIAFVMSSL